VACCLPASGAATWSALVVSEKGGRLKFTPRKMRYKRTSARDRQKSRVGNPHPHHRGEPDGRPTTYLTTEPGQSLYREGLWQLVSGPVRRGAVTALYGPQITRGRRNHCGRERRDRESAHGDLRLGISRRKAKLYTDAADRKRLAGEAMTLLASGRTHERTVDFDSFPELIPDPAVRRARGVLDLYPVGAPAGAIGPIEPLRNNPLESHVAGDPEQDVADLALLVFSALLVLCNEDAIDAALQQRG
jgi:hypothetical protein